MVETHILDSFTNFFLNDLFGSVMLGSLFLIMLVLAFLFFSDSPKIALLLFPTMLLFGLTSVGVAQWVAVLLWAGMGAVWGMILKRFIGG